MNPQNCFPFGKLLTEIFLSEDYLSEDFLPEKFTLNEVQKVQETILDISILPANFRRKINDYVIETDEYTQGAGHRPARLFKRK